MNTIEVPNDITREFLFRLPPDTMINYCTTHKEKLTLCSDALFLRNYVHNNYGGIDFFTIQRPGTDWEKFLFVHRLIQEMEAWDGNDLTVDRFQYIYHYPDDEQLQEDEDKFARDIFFRSPSLDRILGEAIRTHSPHLLWYLLNIYSVKVSFVNVDQLIETGIISDKEYLSNMTEPIGGLLTQAYVEVLRSGDAIMLNLMHQYHAPTLAIINVYRNAIATGDINLVQKLTSFDLKGGLLGSSQISSGDILLAEQQGQPQIADYLRKQLEAAREQGRKRREERARSRK